MVYQRRRGIDATVYLITEQMDGRGNPHKVPDLDNPVQVRVWYYPQRSAQAEVAGQQEINMTRIGVAPIEGVSLWGRVDMMGKSWDVANPPAYHHGTRHNRHWSIDLRERP